MTASFLTGEFYPTPSAVASQMIAPYADLIRAGAFVLDPSAGKGDLLQAAAHVAPYGSKDKLYAVEIDPDLQNVLRGRGFKVVGDDFLGFAAPYHFDLIVMNPPFSAGARHLLKAWEMLRGGHIACLLNAETVRNPHTAERELLATIIAEHGTAEYLGPVFSTAERRTDVGVALVRLEKKAADRFAFTGMKQDAGTGADGGSFEHVLDNAPARNDLIGSLVSSYQSAARALEAVIRTENALRAYTADFWRGYHDRRTLDNLEELRRNSNGAAYFNAYLDALKAAAWNQVFQRTNFRAIMTDKVKRDFETWQQVQGGVEFSKANINAFFEMLLENRGGILHQCVLEVFDNMTAYDKKNKVHVEGWKTNSAYKVNRKVILPWFIECDWSWRIRYDRRDKLTDIDRAMCLVAGKRLENVRTIEAALTERFAEHNARHSANAAPRPFDTSDNVVQSEFFKIRYFKKGTLHLEFLDKFVWDEFNRMAAKGKNWLPDSE